MCLLTVCSSTFKKENSDIILKGDNPKKKLIKGEKIWAFGQYMPISIQTTNLPSPSTKSKCFHNNTDYITLKALFSLCMRSKASLSF